MTVSTTTSRSRRDLFDEVERITDVVGIADLTTLELELLAAVLRPAHARVAPAVPRTPVLRLVQNDHD
jgi:hypothetical protein